MNNDLLYKLKGKIKINIKGKNVERFIKRLNFNKIEILNISDYKPSSVSIIIYKKDYDKVIELKSIYKINKIEEYGSLKIKKVTNKYKYVLIFLFFSLFVILILSNVIFDIEVVYNKKDVRTMIEKELENYDIKKYKFVKTYDEVENIKKSILDKYKDKLEWIEITRVGTKYIVKLQERIIPDNKTVNSKQNVIAKKGAVLKKIIAQNGNVVKDIDTYVNKGEVVISGNIYLNENLMDTVSALGKIYGEVWYNVSVEYPYVYIETKKTNNYKNVFTLKLFNKNIELTKNPFKEKTYDEKVILSSNYLPISFNLQKQNEVINIEELLTNEEAINKAIDKAIDKVKLTLKSDEYIMDYKVLKTTTNDNKVIVDIFFTVFEDITDYEIIEGE